MNRLIYFFLVILVIIKTPLLTGCANIIPPTGGLRDTLPPVLVKSMPDNYNLHFRGKIITFNFNEYIELNEINKNLIVSPVPKSDPRITSNLKTITVKLRDTLEPNTTYSLNFGRAIRDINEGNVFKNFTYVFTTGPYIDSMQFSGKVILAATGKIDSTLIVILHTKTDDSAVAKDRPRYFTNLDTGGNFVFRHIQPGTYVIYALKDESGQKKYLTKTQSFAFADSPVVIQQNNTPITLYAYEDTAGARITKKTISKTGAAKKTEKEKRLIVQLNLPSGQLDLLSTLEMQFQTPLKFFDSSKVRFTDENFKDITQFYYAEDSNRKKITIFYNWVMDTKYHIIASKEFAEDTLGGKLLKTDTISFKTKKESDYGSVRLRFINLDLKKNPVLQFVQSDAVKEAYIFGSSNIYFKKLFVPGDYELRILYDDNKNGVWDPGEFFNKHKQPEKVKPIRQKLTVKSNWDNETDIVL